MECNQYNIKDSFYFDSVTFIETYNYFLKVFKKNIFFILNKFLMKSITMKLVLAICIVCYHFGSLVNSFYIHKNLSK